MTLSTNYNFNLYFLFIIFPIIFLLVLYLFIQKKFQYELLLQENNELIYLNYLLNTGIKEKELLLNEIHHRIKNNLQLVMSLLNIQAHSNDNISIQEFLENGQSRILTMYLIHQNLYLTKNFNNIDFQEYLENLTKNIMYTFGRSDVEFKINANRSCFNFDTAIPLALIVNELVNNSLKHALPKGYEGKIDILIRKMTNNSYELHVRDNGIIQLTTSNRNINGQGLEIVNLLVVQIKGSLRKLNEFGTEYIIEFQNLN